MLYTVRIEPDPEDKSRYADEKDYRKQQLDAAKSLNVISGVGGGIAFLGLIAVVWYACVASATLTQLQVQQRPYVWLTTKSSPTYALDKDLLWDVDWGNYGLTPALKVRGCTQIAWGSNILSLIHPPFLD